MIFLALAVALFAAIHLIAAIPSLKSRLKDRLGKAYGATFGGTSVVALVLVILAWRAAPFEPVYDPPTWGIYVAFALMLAAFLCLGIFVFRGHTHRILRFPLAIAAMLWGTGHLLANGDRASLILFGGLAVYGAIHLLLGLLNGIRTVDEVRGGHDMLAVLTGLALYAAMMQLHGHVIGVPLFTIEDLAGLGKK